MSDRFYFLDQNYNLDYRFVYDITDKSVELVYTKDLEKNGVVVSEDYDGVNKLFYKGSTMWYKVRTYYQDSINSSGSLFKNLCIYDVNGMNFVLVLTVGFLSGQVALSAYSDVKLFESSALAGIDCEYNIVNMDSEGVHIYVPDLMFNYIIELYNRRDFDGIMRSVYNLLGTRIYMMIRNFKTDKLYARLLKWK